MNSSEVPRRPSPRNIILSVFLVAFCALVYFVLFHPVCQPIPLSRLPAFEAVRSLEERAASGEPFEKRDGRWQICKSPLARAFTF
jgi:hypothetical protein